MKISIHGKKRDHDDARSSSDIGDMSIPHQEFLRALNTRFRTIRLRDAEENVLSLEIDYRELIPLSHHLHNYTGFKLLQLISCVDWDEDNAFQMTYFIWNQEDKIQLLFAFRIAKDSGVRIPSMIPIWPHAETFERELREMYGVSFDGNQRQDESFLLEDWDGPPPMLREFDTLAFSIERFGERPGRYSENTRRYIGEKVGEYDLSWRVPGKRE